MQAKSMIVATALAGALSATGFAQTPQTANPATGQPGQPATGTSDRTVVPSGERNETTLTGCLEKNKSGGFWLTKAMAASGSSGAVGTSGSATAGATGTAGTAGHGAAAAGMIYNLEGDGKPGGPDLEKHVGQKVEVTGKVDDTKSSDKLKAPSAAAATGDKELDAQDFHVASIKMIAGSCQ